MRGIRYCRIGCLLLAAAFSAFVILPFCSSERRLHLKAVWSAALLRALGVELKADLSALVPGALIVANHISWLDIFAINACLPAAFIAKEEVRHWPVFGWLAAKNDTVFLRRGSRGHARIINQEIAEILASGKHVAVFPEGTTTDGTHLLHFHAALIQPALTANRPVVPVALSYWESDGRRSLAPRYDGTISLGECLRAIIGRRQLIVQVSALPPLGLDGEDRRQVALAAREAIAGAAGLAC